MNGQPKQFVLSEQFSLHINLRTGALGGEREDSSPFQRHLAMHTDWSMGSMKIADLHAHKARRRTTYNPYKRNIIHSIEVLYEEMLWKLYKITTKAITTFPKLHNRDAWTHYRDHSTIYQ